MQVRADVDAVRDAVQLEVAQGVEGLTAARLSFDAALIGLRAASESYRVRRMQLEAGAAVTSDLIDADADLTRARLQLVDAAIELHLTDARLRHAIGE